MNSPSNVVEEREAAAPRQTEFALRVAVCAWCKPTSADGGMQVWSHGICPRHLRKMRLKMTQQTLAARKHN
jgi:hypothetical protein